MAIRYNSGSPSELALLKKALGEVITLKRHGCKYEQREFARIAQISNSHLRKIENGEVSPTLSTIAKIAAALGTDASELVSEACFRADQMSKDSSNPPSSPDATRSSNGLGAQPVPLQGSFMQSQTPHKLSAIARTVSLPTPRVSHYEYAVIVFDMA